VDGRWAHYHQEKCLTDGGSRFTKCSTHPESEDAGAGGPPLVTVTDVPCARRWTSHDEPRGPRLHVDEQPPVRLPSKSACTCRRPPPFIANLFITNGSRCVVNGLAPQLQIRPPSTNGPDSNAKQQSSAAKPRRSPESSSLTATGRWSMAAAPSSRQHAFHSAHRIGTKANKAAPPPPRVLRSTRQPADQKQRTFTFSTAFGQRLVITADGPKVERPWPVIFPRNHHLHPFFQPIHGHRAAILVDISIPSPLLLFPAKKVNSRPVGQPKNNGRSLLVSCCVSGKARRGREGGKY
jgi:hypothetical protein